MGMKRSTGEVTPSRNFPRRYDTRSSTRKDDEGRVSRSVNHTQGADIIGDHCDNNFNSAYEADSTMEAASKDRQQQPKRRKRCPGKRGKGSSRTHPKAYDPMLDPDLHSRSRGSGKSLEYWDSEISHWVPAVYHHEIRDLLIARASRNGQDRYTDLATRVGGNLGSNDVTSFLSEQAKWYKDTEEVDYENGDDESQHVHNVRGDVLAMEGDGTDYTGKYDEMMPERWYEGGRLVIDRANAPMYIFPDLPLTLSSQIEPWLLTAIKRLDRRINARDVWARWPQNATTLTNMKNKIIRFCSLNGLVNWGKRFPKRTRYGGSQIAKTSTLQELREALVNQTANSHSSQFIRQGGAAKFSDKAGEQAQPPFSTDVSAMSLVNVQQSGYTAYHDNGSHYQGVAQGYDDAGLDYVRTFSSPYFMPGQNHAYPWTYSTAI